MMETVITLKPHDQWRHVPTWYSAWAPTWLKPVLRRITPDHISTEQLVAELNDGGEDPGCHERVDDAHQGADRHAHDRRADAGRDQDLWRRHQGDRARRDARSRRLLPAVQGTRSVFAERTGGGYFLDFVWKRDALARYGLSIDRGRADGGDERQSAATP